MSTLTQEDRDQIQTIVEETWVKASLSSDWDTVTALCTEDIDYMPADIPWVHGRNELKGFRYSGVDRAYMSLIRQFGGTGSGWNTLNSMRHVDTECSVIVAGEKFQ